MVIEPVFANKTEHNLDFHQSALSFRADLHFVEPNQKLYLIHQYSLEETQFCDVRSVHRIARNPQKCKSTLKAKVFRKK